MSKKSQAEIAVSVYTWSIGRICFANDETCHQKSLYNNIVTHSKPWTDNLGNVIIN